MVPLAGGENPVDEIERSMLDRCVAKGLSHDEPGAQDVPTSSLGECKIQSWIHSSSLLPRFAGLKLLSNLLIP